MCWSRTDASFTWSGCGVRARVAQVVLELQGKKDRHKHAACSSIKHSLATYDALSVSDSGLVALQPVATAEPSIRSQRTQLLHREHESMHVRYQYNIRSAKM